MSDQGKWFKLWCSSLDDDDLENLSIHEWFGWARFGAHMKAHGKDGKIRLRAPATAVVNLLRVPGFSDAVDMIKRFPNYIVDGLERGSEGGEKTGVFVTPDVTVTVSIRCRNWNKYQGDWSRDRVRKHRKGVTPNVTPQEEKRREEKRKEEKRVERPTPQQVSEYAKSIGYSLDGTTFVNHYEASGWMRGKTPLKNWKAAVRIWKSKETPKAKENLVI